MANQLLQNNGFEDELESYITQGSVSTNSDIAYSGKKSALLLATPMAIAELSQVVFFISPGSPVNFSFYARRFRSGDVEKVSNFRAEVNFISALGTVIPSGIVIKGRGRDISENVWKRYNGYAVAPFGTIAAQVIIRLEPPESGTSGLLVDELELVSEVAMPAPAPAPASMPQPGIPAFPALPIIPSSPVPASPAQQQNPAVSGMPFPIPPFTSLPFTNPMFPGLPFTNPAFPGSPFGNPPFPGLPFANPVFPGSPFGNPMFPGLPFANPTVPGLPFTNPVFPGSPFANPSFPGLPFANPIFPGSPFPNMTPPAPASPVQQANPAFPGSPLANFPVPPELLYPGSPLAHLLYPSSLSNMTPKAPGAPKKEDQGRHPSKGGNTPEPGQNEK